MTLKISILLFLFVTAMIGCKNKGEHSIEPSSNQNNQPIDPTEVTVTTVGHLSADSLKQFAKSFGLGQLANKFKYNVTIGKINYKTTYKNKPITASGLIYLPDTIKASPILCLNHGTTFIKAEAPSISPNLSGAELASSNGFITVMPDYIGYGSSSDIFHPYYDEKSSAASVVDIIKATRSYAQRSKIPLNDKIFLAGYSEGGYVTLAAQKAIEANPNLDWKLSGVAAGAGGYDMQDMMHNILSTNYYSYPSYLAFIIKSYNLTYDWNYNMNHFFKPTYATFLDKTLDGNVGGSYINSQLTTRIDSLFNGTFYKGITADSSEVKFNAAIKDNSLTDWAPSTPLKLYHGTSDEIIPYSNSQTTLNKLKSNGAKSIDLIPISGGTHSSSFIPMIQYFFPWFEKLNAE